MNKSVAHKLTPSTSTADIRAFFDRFARENTEQHGNPSRLLSYRIALLRRHARLQRSDIVLDLGCGNGHHLFALDGAFDMGIGIDISPAMVASAQRASSAFTGSRYQFQADNAETLSSIDDAAIDVAFCVGALEHMIDKPAVIRAVRRVLRPGGRFVCLTLNNDYLWYSCVAPRLRYETRHLATDLRLNATDARQLLADAGFSSIQVTPWTFVPAGDMPKGWARVFRMLDGAGRLLRISTLRGGLVLTGE